MHSELPLPLTGEAMSLATARTVIIPPPPRPRRRAARAVTWETSLVVPESRFGSGFEDGFADGIGQSHGAPGEAAEEMREPGVARRLWRLVMALFARNGGIIL